MYMNVHCPNMYRSFSEDLVFMIHCPVFMVQCPVSMVSVSMVSGFHGIWFPWYMYLVSMVSGFHGITSNANVEVTTNLLAC